MKRDGAAGSIPHLDGVTEQAAEPEASAARAARRGHQLPGKDVPDPIALVTHLDDHLAVRVPDPQRRGGPAVNNRVRRDLVDREHQLAGACAVQARGPREGPHRPAYG